MAGSISIRTSSGRSVVRPIENCQQSQKTKSGQYTTGEDTLESMRDKHPIVGKILEYRGLQNFSAPTLMHFHNLLILKQEKYMTIQSGNYLNRSFGVRQIPTFNIPIRDEEGREIRKAFIPDEGCTFLSVDYSQIELRIMAHLSKDPTMIEAFVIMLMIHATTASKIYKGFERCDKRHIKQKQLI